MFDSIGDSDSTSPAGDWDTIIPDPWRGNDERSVAVPDNLDTWVAGPSLAGYLVGLDRSRIAGYDLVTVLQAEARMVSFFQARMYQTIAEMGTLPQLNGPETAASEIGAALQLTRQTAWFEYEFAVALNAHPRIAEALSSGLIDLRRARVIVSGLQGVDNETAARVLERVLNGVSERTTGQIAAQIRRMVIASNPQQALATYETALEGRKLVVYENPDGTANLFAANLPPDRVNAIRRKIEELSRSAKTSDETRTADQLRADTFLDLLEDRVTGGQGRAFVDISIDLTTLMGLDDNPAHIPGYGPILAEIARKAVLDQIASPWEFTVTDQGQPVSTGTLSRRPTNAMKRRIRSRYPTCIHPGCRRPARQSDIDHRVEWSRNGKTALDNLAPLCEHHHQLKDSGWRYRRLPDGSFEFTSPLGHTYITCGQSP